MQRRREKQRSKEAGKSREAEKQRTRNQKKGGKNKTKKIALHNLHI
jgi:hypothetical protein